MRARTVLSWLLAAAVAPVLPAGAQGEAGGKRDFQPSGASATSMDTAEGSIVADGLPPGIAETRERRERLVELLRDVLPPGRRGAFLLEGAVEPDLGEFRQESSFYYLTGLDVSGATMALLFDGERAGERLYLPPVEDSFERYIGDVLEAGSTDPATGAPDPERARAIEASGFRGESAGDPGAVRPAGEVAGDLRTWLGRRGTLFLAEVTTVDGRPVLAPGSLPEALAGRSRRIEVTSAAFALRKLRMVKSPGEIANIRKAVEITCEAHREALSATRPGIPEYLVEGAIEQAFIRSGARVAAFPSIVGSGPNSTVLHYYRNGRTMGEDELVVIDIGAEFGRYAADVTRTLPTSGRFLPGQREVYEAVLLAQGEAMKLAAPGSSIAKIDGKAKEILAGRGLAEGYWHSCCHFVGLDVHDVGGRDIELEPGMVLTVEPGVYLPAKGFGVRIEDMVLITPEGHELLSDCAPSAPEAIESAMLERGVSRDAPASRPR